MPKISLIIPVFNEAELIKPFLENVSTALRPLEEREFQFELLFVNDGSSDASLATLLKALRNDSRICVIDFSRNFGKEAALTAGLDEATGDAVVPIDVDLQDPPDLIPTLISRWREGYEVVLARRFVRSSDSILRRQASHWFYKLHNLMAETAIPENVGDFQLLDRSVVDALRHIQERRRFMKGLFAWVGFRTAVVTYHQQGRSVGKSKFSTWKLWNFALEAITSFSTVPLRLWLYVGLFTSIVSFAYMSYVVVRTLIFGVDVPGYASLVAAVLLLGGLQLIGIGVIGEYLGRVYLEAKRRPHYIVRSRYMSEASK